MTKQEIALLNFAQRISTGYMAVAIGDKLSFGEPAYDLKLRLRQIQQLHKLFDYEYGKPESDLQLLYSTVIVINTLLNNFRLSGTYVVRETEIVPIPVKYANFIIISSGGEGETYTFTNGIHANNNIVKLGLDLTTVGTTNSGALTEDTYLITTGNKSLSLGTSSIDDPENEQSIILADGIGNKRIVIIQKSNNQIKEIRFEDGQPIKITDAIHSIGLVYALDYSANGKLNDNWIPSWGAVKSLVEGGSGVHISATGNINLGLDLATSGTTNKGILTGTTAIVYGDLIAANYSGVIIERTKASLIAANSVLDNTVVICDNEGNLSIRKNKNGLPQDITFLGADDSITIIDQVMEKGLVYQDDYSLNGKIDDRWIPDWGAVKSFLTIESFEYVTDTDGNLDL